ncbi:MAG: hypothetical protein XD85_0463 [Parcubacteria bacterium 34_609]|nr:MAG: hypothetical protein XD85_0463 [Parcubacteria bacterium 34_609]KUK98236.1 MAG: hypothetical protein XE08_0625 [Parcubacteria bacterium 32_520]
MTPVEDILQPKTNFIILWWGAGVDERDGFENRCG